MASPDDFPSRIKGRKVPETIYVPPYSELILPLEPPVNSYVILETDTPDRIEETFEMAFLRSITMRPALRWTLEVVRTVRDRNTHGSKHARELLSKHLQNSFIYRIPDTSTDPRELFQYAKICRTVAHHMRHLEGYKDFVIFVGRMGMWCEHPNMPFIYINTQIQEPGITEKGMLKELVDRGLGTALVADQSKIPLLKLLKAPKTISGLLVQFNGKYPQYKFFMEPRDNQGSLQDILPVDLSNPLHDNNKYAHILNVLIGTHQGNLAQQAIISGVFLQRQQSIPSHLATQLKLDEKQSYIFAISFQEWLAKQLLFDQNLSVIDFVKRLVSETCMSGALLGEVIALASLYTTGNVEMLGFPSSELPLASSHFSTFDLSNKAQYLRDHVPPMFDNIPELREMSEAYRAIINAIPTPVAHLSPLDHRMAEIGRTAKHIDRAYFTNDIPPEFIDYGVHVSALPPKNTNQEGQKKDEQSRLEKLNMYEKGRAMQGITLLLMSIAYPDCLVVPEMAITAGLKETDNGIKGFIGTRADGAVFRITSDESIGDRIAIIEAKWGQAFSNIIETIIKQRGVMNTRERHFLIRLLGDSTAQDISSEQFHIQSVGKDQLTTNFWDHNSDRSHSLVEHLMIEDMLDALPQGVLKVLENVAILQLIADKPAGVATQEQLNTRLRLYQGLDTHPVPCTS
ncbi:MAG: hypothetical protein WCO06_03545 [Candidatus Roizmanbacteria bacterium]